MPRPASTSSPARSGRRKAGPAVAVAVASLIFAAGARAADRTWIDPTGGLFSDSANWQDGLVPGAADAALFNLAGQTFTVDFNANATNDRLVLRNGEITFDLGDNTYELTNPDTGSSGGSPSIVVGSTSTDNAFLTVGDGTLAGVVTRVGDSTGSTGELVVTSGGALELSNALRVGSSGDGTLRIESGGAASSNGAFLGTFSTGTASVTLTGSGSTWSNSSTFAVATAGDALVTVQNQAVLTTAAATIGWNAGSTGSVQISGAGSTWNGGSITVGLSGSGALTVSAGAELIASADTRIGYNSGSTGIVTVTGSESVLNSSGAQTVGRSGAGTLLIEAGAQMIGSTVLVGVVAGSTGTATVTGAGSTWTSTGDLFLGGSAIAAGGKGIIDIVDAGTLAVGGTLKVWDTTDTRLQIDGGGTVAATSLDLGGNPARLTDHWIDGTLRLNGGTISNLGVGDALIIPAGGTLAGNGTVAGKLHIEGAIAPGNSAGTLTVGTIAQPKDAHLEPGGEYHWEISDATGSPGTGAGYDLLEVSGVLHVNATSATQFVVRIVAGVVANWNPNVDQQWVIAQADSVSGFDPEDFFVDPADFADDNDVFGDFSLFESGGDLHLSYVYVPEPGGLAALVGAGFGLLLRRRRRRLAPAF